MNTKPRIATDTVTAIHRKIRNAIRNPVKRFPTFSFFTSPRTVPGATSGR